MCVWIMNHRSLWWGIQSVLQGHFRPLYFPIQVASVENPVQKVRNFLKRKTYFYIKNILSKRRSKFVELQAVMFLVYLKYISRQKGNLKDLLLSTTWSRPLCSCMGTATLCCSHHCYLSVALTVKLNWYTETIYMHSNT